MMARNNEARLDRHHRLFLTNQERLNDIQNNQYLISKHEHAATLVYMRHTPSLRNFMLTRNSFDIRIAARRKYANKTNLVDIDRPYRLKAGDLKHTPLIHAIIVKNFINVCTLLRIGADPNLPDDGWDCTFVFGDTCRTPLQYAIMIGSITICKLLILFGADVNGVDDILCSPIKAACSHRELDIIRMLVMYGGNVNKEDTNNHTPLSCCIVAIFNEIRNPTLFSSLHTDVVQLLFKMRANIEHEQVVRELQNNNISDFKSFYGPYCTASGLYVHTDPPYPPLITSYRRLRAQFAPPEAVSMAILARRCARFEASAAVHGQTEAIDSALGTLSILPSDLLAKIAAHALGRMGRITPPALAARE